MFQIFALKQNIKPRPIIISGQALTNISAILSCLENGETKTIKTEAVEEKTVPVETLDPAKAIEEANS